MAERFLSESLPGQLADNMAELVTRLRLSSTLPVFSSTAASCLPRLVVMARILEGMGARDTDLPRLGKTIISLTDFLVEVPAAGGPALNPSLQRLVGFLESFLQGLDNGEGLDTWLSHPRWLALRRSFSNYQSSLAVFDELDDVIYQFKRQQDGNFLPPAIPEAMVRRWADVRRQGDLVFGSTGMESLAGVGVILLLESEISRHFLKEKLKRGGAEVLVAATAVEALEMCRSLDIAQAVLCDQVAPGHNLGEFRRLAGQASQPMHVPLILVTLGDSSGQLSNLDRAKNLGAQGVWRDPYDLSDLLPCILHGNQ